MYLRTLLIVMTLFVTTGCTIRPIAHIDPPDVTVEALDAPVPKTAAEQDVATKKDAANKARASGDVEDTLKAERALASARVRLAREQVKQWEQTVKDKDDEIREERDRNRQEFLYWFSGICGFLAMLAVAGAIVWPTTRVITRPIAAILGVLVPASLFAAWLVPYLTYVGLGIGALITAAGAWYLARNEKAHQLKDKAASQVAAAVEDAKNRIPEFGSAYKDIFRGHIDSDADALLNSHRNELAAMAADETARIARMRAA